jgi:Ca2+-binding EF-hand superfamily protein
MSEHWRTKTNKHTSFLHLVLFQDDSQDAIVKITYAGVTNLQSTSSRFTIPEWNQQGKDIYSVGMIAYKLLSGGKEPPTDMDTQRVVPGTNLFLGRRWKLISISKNAKNFIEKCLHSWDTKPQFTVEHALQHLWMTQEHVHRSDTSRPSDTMNDVVVTKSYTVGSSLTISEPITGNVPVVSLSAEQYSRDIKSKIETNMNENEMKPNDINDTIEDDIPVFVPITTIENQVVESNNVKNDDIPDIPDEAAENDTIDESTQQSPMIDEHTASSEINTPFVDASVIGNQSSLNNVSQQPKSETGVIGESVVEDDISKLPDQPMLDDSTEADTPEEFMDLRNAFDEVTTGSEDNLVTIDTLKKRLRTRYKEEEVNTWFQGEKAQDTRSLNYKVFLKKVIQNRRTIEIQRVDTAFKKIDKGRQGYVTVGNLRAVLDRDNITINDNMEQIIKAADTNRDGKISYENFEHVVQNFLSSTNQ